MSRRTLLMHEIQEISYRLNDGRNQQLIEKAWSSSPGFWSQALTDPYVTVSRHTALLFEGLIMCQ